MSRIAWAILLGGTSLAVAHGQFQRLPGRGAAAEPVEWAASVLPETAAAARPAPLLAAWRATLGRPF